MPEISRTHMGGTMRLGLRPTVFDSRASSWSQLQKLYAGSEKIWERHRHRYEVNPEYVARLVESGLAFVGKDEQGVRMQALELNGAVYDTRQRAPYNVCVQITHISSPFRRIQNFVHAHLTLHRLSLDLWLRPRVHPSSQNR
jgi:CTP synthase